MRYATEAAPAVRYDWATGLYCRWYIEARTDEELAHALRTGKRVFVVRLKALSRDCTEQVATWLRSGLRGYDLAGVVGPDTFAVVVADTDRERVEALLNRARAAIPSPIITSVVYFPDDGLTFDALLRQATAQWAELAA